MYWQTTLIALAFMGIYFLVSGIINRKFHWVTTLNLALISLLVALSIVLTNLVGYSRILFGKQVELGNFLIFSAGMLFGPWAGLVSAIASDLIGSLIFLGGTFHIGFMISKIGFGVFGALVFSKIAFSWWRLKLLFFVGIAVVLQLFLFHPLALYGTMVNDWQTLWARLLIVIPNKLITLIIEMVAYPLLSFITFRLWYFLYTNRHQTIRLWANRFQEINFQWIPKLKRIKNMIWKN